MKMFISFLAILFSQLASVKGSACSSFASTSAKFAVMAKSYDWNYYAGIALINKRNVKKSSLVASTDSPVVWVSKYGSLTFTQFGRDFPISGLNEKGLGIEILWDYDTNGPADSGSLPAVNEAQWIQYQLDTAKNVAEMIANVKAVRMKKIIAPVHYLACDLSDACAAFEFDGNSVTITQGEGMKVKALTNSHYKNSAEHLRDYEGFGGRSTVPWGRTESLDRFVILSAQLDELNVQPGVNAAVSFSWDMLKSVRQTNHSMWNLVHDLKGGASHFRMLAHGDRTKDFKLSSFDFSCKTPAKILDLEANFEGDMTAKFADYDPALNRSIVELSGQKLSLPQAMVNAVAHYPETTRCMEE